MATAGTTFCMIRFSGQLFLEDAVRAEKMVRSDRLPYKADADLMGRPESDSASHEAPNFEIASCQNFRIRRNYSLPPQTSPGLFSGLPTSLHTNSYEHKPDEKVFHN